MRHLPTGIEAKSATKSQHANRRAARELLEARVMAVMQEQERSRLDKARLSMVGSGQRADKIRTYRKQDNSVNDHRNGKKVRLTDILKGKIELLFC